MVLVIAPGGPDELAFPRLDASINSRLTIRRREAPHQSPSNNQVSRGEAHNVMMAARRPIREVGVPTVHRFGPYRLWFFSDENQATNEPEHIHVESGNGWAIFWLRPVSVRDHRGYNPRELHRIRRIVTANREQLLRQWHEFFGKPS